MIPEREREALMRLTMCAREECGMCKYKETCNFDFQYETATRCMNILADALNADRKIEPTISKMEQVDKDINVRSKTEPQTDWKDQMWKEACREEADRLLETQMKDEPQTDCAWK